MNNANVTITRSSNDVIRLCVSDGPSRQRVVEVEMDMAEFAACITGLASAEGRTHYVISPKEAERIGRTLETTECHCQKVSGLSKEDQEKSVYSHFKESGIALMGWEIFSTGVNSQQRGEHHRYVCRRWV